jgi:pimeloyl-ACP methyl ester carboxylesterase
MMRGAVVALIFLLLGTLAASAEEDVVLTGTHQGADYLLHRPTGWNGGLVLFAHGYSGEGKGRGEIADGYLRPHLEAGQYAFATSGYRATTYRPDWFLEDLVAVRALFVEKFGTPRWTILYGDSMGGHVVVAGLETHPTLFQGGMAECGVVDGVGLIDWFYAYTAAAEYLSGVPLLDASPDDFEKAREKFVAVMGKPGAYTERGRRFDSVVRHLAGGDLPLWEESLAENYLDDLRARRPGPNYAQEFARHADTRGIVYGIAPGLGVDAATLNRDIRRVVPEPGARTSTVPAFAPFTGRIRVPLISLHTTGDTDVPFRLEQNYRRRTIAAGTDRLLVQRTQRRAKHCAFDASFREAAFDDLVKWIERGVVPKGENVLGDVSKLGEP